MSETEQEADDREMREFEKMSRKAWEDIAADERTNTFVAQCQSIRSTQGEVDVYRYHLYGQRRNAEVRSVKSFVIESDRADEFKLGYWYAIRCERLDTHTMGDGRKVPILRHEHLAELPWP